MFYLYSGSFVNTELTDRFKKKKKTLDRLEYNMTLQLMQAENFKIERRGAPVAQLLGVGLLLGS